MKIRKVICRSLPFILFAVVASYSIGYSGNIPPVSPPECVADCGDGGGGGGGGGRGRERDRPQPAGPTPAQREQARAKALNDANERGISCFERKDWRCAISNFQEALEYAPYNPSLQRNLKRAQEEAARQPGIASQQLLSTVHHGNQATQSGDAGTARDQGGKGFDAGGRNVGGLQPPVVYSRNYGYREPVVTPANRTPAIAHFEKERDTSKKKRAELEKRLNELQNDPKKSEVEVAIVKQDISNAKNKENYLNFSIEVELKKAPDAKK